MVIKHDASLEEALEAAESCERHFRADGTRKGEKRYVMPRKTRAGCRLWAVFAEEDGHRGRIVTAHEPASQKARRAPTEARD